MAGEKLKQHFLSIERNQFLLSTRSKNVQEGLKLVLKTNKGHDYYRNQEQKIGNRSDQFLFFVSNCMALLRYM